MKKLSLLLVVLLAAGSAGLYGQMQIGTTFTITGDATAHAGYDIDDEQFGFKNESSANIKLELVAKQSSMKPEEMMSGWYGSIELKDFKIIIDHDEEDSDPYVKAYKAGADGTCANDMTKTYKKDDYITLACAGVADTREHQRSKLVVTEPDIVATLKNGPLFLRIFAAPDNKADLIAHIEDDEARDHAAIGDDDGNDVGREINKGHGVTLGYDTGNGLSLAVGVSSEEAHDSAKKGSYAVSADLGVNVGPADLKIAFAQGIENEEDAAPAGANDTGIAGLLTTTFGDMKLSVGADVELSGDPDTAEDERMDYDLGANAKINLTPTTSLMADFIYSTEVDVASDVQVKVDDKSGLVDSLDLAVTWGMFDLSGGDDADGAPATENDEADMFMEGKLDYHLSETLGGTLTPGTTVTVNQIDGADATVGLEVRAVLTDAIPLTTFGLKWKTGMLFEADGKDAKQGEVTVWTKIKY